MLRASCAEHTLSAPNKGCLYQQWEGSKEKRNTQEEKLETLVRKLTCCIYKMTMYCIDG